MSMSTSISFTVRPTGFRAWLTLFVLLAGAAAARAQVSASLDTGSPLNLIWPGDEGRVALVVRNAGGEAVEGRVEVEVASFDATAEATRHASDVVVPASGEVRVELPTDLWSDGRRGIKYVTYAVRPTAGEAVEGQASVGYFDPVGPPPSGYDGFRYSINGGAGGGDGDDPGEVAKLVEAATAVGATTTRYEFKWDFIQPEPGGFNWSPERLPHDENVQLALDAGLEVQALLDYNVRWAAPPEVRDGSYTDWLFTYPTTVEPWRQFMRAWAGRYGDRVKWVEVWNEPGWHGMSGEHPERYPNERYVEMLCATQEEMEAVDPAIRVMTGGFARFNDPMGLSRHVIANADDCYEIFTHHAHGGLEQLVVEVGLIRQSFAEAGLDVKPLYFNETAVPHERPGADEERRVASELVKINTYLQSEGAIGHSWFILRWKGTGRDDWGMFDSDWQPRAVAPAHAAMVRTLRGMSFERRLDAGDGRYALLFGNDPDRRDEWAVVAWRQDAMVADAALGLRVDADATAARADLMGNESELAAAAGLVAIDVRADGPSYTIIRNQADAPTAAGLLVAPEAALVSAGQSSRVAAAVTNYGSSPLEPRLSWSLPAGVELADAERSSIADIAAGATAETSAAVRADDFAGGTATVAYDLGDIGSGRLDVPMTAALSIPAGDVRGEATPDRPADFVLDADVDVRNRFDDILGGEARQWQGADDLSAKVWLGTGPAAGGDGKALTVRVEVRDDRHVQPYRGNEAWRGDSVQISLAVPAQAGNWQAGLLLTGDNAETSAGRAESHLYHGPADAGNPWDRMGVAARRSGDVTTYTAALGYDDFGLSDELLASGVRFSAIVNDLDDADEAQPLREGHIQISDGIADGNDPRKLPVIRFEAD